MSICRILFKLAVCWRNFLPISTSLPWRWRWLPYSFVCCYQCCSWTSSKNKQCITYRTDCSECYKTVWCHHNNVHNLHCLFGSLSCTGIKCLLLFYELSHHCGVTEMCVDTHPFTSRIGIKWYVRVTQCLFLAISVKRLMFKHVIKDYFLKVLKMSWPPNLCKC